MALVVVVLLCPKYNHCKRPESYSLAIYTVPTKLFIYSKIQTPRARPLPERHKHHKQQPTEHVVRAGTNGRWRLHFLLSKFSSVNLRSTDVTLFT